MQVIPLLIATFIPIAFLFVIYKLDLYKTGYFRFILLSFFAGGVAFGIASLVNQNLISRTAIDYLIVVQFVAPILEESLKCLILIYQVNRPSFTYYVEGATYGFAAGIGFAIFENYQYILTSSADSGLSIAIARVLSTNLMHASATSMSGIFIGQAKFHKSIKGFLYGVFGVLLGILTHMIYNNLVTRLSVGYLLILAIAFGFISAGVIAFSMRQGMKVEKAWIEEKLGAEDRVTSGEARLVQGMNRLKAVLQPFTAKFGPKKAAQAEQFLVIQARIGILRKKLDLLTDPQLKAGIHSQISDLQSEMDTIRRSLGAYAMLHIRQTFPSNVSPVWNSISDAIQLKTQETPTGNRINLWDNLAARQAEKSPGQQSNHPQEE